MTWGLTLAVVALAGWVWYLHIIVRRLTIVAGLMVRDFSADLETLRAEIKAAR
jgi:hypothetical protein